MTQKKETPAIIIAHGFLMNKYVMTFLGNAFKKLGYDTYQYDYASIIYNEDICFKEIDNLVKSIPNKTKYFLGHSMGGLVLRKYLERQNYLDPARTSLVTLGTPHSGSEIAKTLDRTPLNHLFTHSGNAGLTKEIKGWSSKYDMGCIAGTKSFGVKNFLSLFLPIALDEPNDGTVYVSEAICPKCLDFCEIDVTHTGMVYSKRVAEQVHHFFENKKFKPELSKTNKANKTITKAKVKLAK